MIDVRKGLFIALVAAFAVFKAYAQGEASIPLNNSRLPSDDLLHLGRRLSLDEAYALKNSRFDLSTLSPAPSAIWMSSEQGSEVDESLPVSKSDSVRFAGALLSASGLFRFNATIGNTTAIVHLDKTLHSMLLRKNFLRLLGYQIPGMKWLENLTVKFDSLAQMNDFLDSQIPRATLGASSRWLVSKDEASFTVILRDVAVTVPSSSDHFNVSQGTPPGGMTSRTLRSLIVPYGLLDLSESANKFEWTVGKLSNNEVILPHFTRSVFTTTVEDAKWILNKIKALSQAQIEKAVRDAHFPSEVATLVSEKILSRRNSLLRLFSIPGSETAINLNISEGQYLRNGKLTREDWEGFATRFAHGDPESPFKDFHWYGLAKIQSIVIDNLVARANQELILLDPRDERGRFVVDQFNEGLEHFIKTGEFLTFPVRTWFYPVLNLGFNVSRDVVVGNYLGTDNLVQIADSLSFSFRIGGNVGIENVPYVPTLAIQGTASVNKNWSHLKPLRNLKQAMKEPYQNMAVPLLKWQIERDLKKLKTISESTNTEVEWDMDKDDSALSEIMDHFNKKLGVGESILYTETISPSVAASGKTGQIFPVELKANASATITTLRRIQFYRKNAKTIQVYDDVGNGLGWSFDVSLEKFIPITRIGYKNTRGDYFVRLHEVNIDPEIKDNPKFFDRAHALSEFMQTGSAELLESMQKPNKVTATYKDRSSKLGLLAWRLKKLKTDSELKVESLNGLTGTFVVLTDERQTGWNWEAFAKDVINYWVGKKFEGVEWSGNPFQNPSETLLGMGETTSVRFEASLNSDESYEERFMRLTDRWEGWSAKVKKVQDKMREINARFGFSIFDELSIENATTLQLFNVSVNMNLYEEGLKRLANMPTDRLIQFEIQHEESEGVYRRGCDENQIRSRRLSSGRRIDTCGSFNALISASQTCQRLISQSKPQKDIARCLTNLFRKTYEKLDYAEITTLLGADNIFIHGSVNGFRNGDEVLNDSISSNTQGRIGGDFWNGPIEVIQQMLGMQGGEFNGYWLRERL